MSPIVHEVNGHKKAFSRYVGWFDSPYQTTPVHDPWPDQPCLICSSTMAPRTPGKHRDPEDVQTVSLLRPGDTRSYFYRVHKACYAAVSTEEITAYEGAILWPEATL